MKLLGTTLIVLGIGAMLAPATAQASLIGDEVDFSFQSPGLPQNNRSDFDETVVDPGVEFTIDFDSTDTIAVDVKAESIVLTMLDDSSFFVNEFLTISDLHWVNDPTGEVVDFTVSGGFSDFDLPGAPGGQPNVSLPDGHSVRLDFNSNSPNELGFLKGDTFTIHLITNHRDIPEPTSAVLLGFGGLAAFLSARRRVDSRS